MAKTEYIETSQVEHVRRLLDSTDELHFPVYVEHRDKPDFMLSTRDHRSFFKSIAR
jgi:hypothetical protein